MFKIVRKATLMVHSFVREAVRENDIVIDATLGNGNDSLFLSEMVPYGRVYSFEVQHNAVEVLEKVIVEKNIKNITLIEDGHQNLDSYVKDKVGVVIFNLGYLPGGDPKIITQAETTMKALRKSLDILRPGGVIIIALYTGHDGGEREADEINNLAKNLPSREYSVMDLHFTNKSDKAPYLIIIEKNDNYNGGK